MIIFTKKRLMEEIMKAINEMPALSSRLLYVGTECPTVHRAHSFEDIKSISGKAGDKYITHKLIIVCRHCGETRTFEDDTNDNFEITKRR